MAGNSLRKKLHIALARARNIEKTAEGRLRREFLHTR
jgi:hypothetical protein